MLNPNDHSVEFAHLREGTAMGRVFSTCMLVTLRKMVELL